MSPMILRASDVAAKPRNAISPPPGEKERQTVRMANPQETGLQMRDMRHTLPGKRVLGLLALSINSYCHTADSR